MRETTLAIWPARTYRERAVRVKGWLFNGLYLSDPDGLRHVLSTHQDRYPKADIQQQILRPALGDGGCAQ